jgi:hypothetical protein
MPLPHATHLLGVFAKSRYALLFILLLVALLLHRYQAEIVPVTAEQVQSQDVVARYLGPMEIRVKRRETGVDIARRDAGLGIEYTPANEPEGSTHPTVLRVVFFKHLNLSADDERLIRMNGPRYTLGLAEDRIVTIAGAGGALITYGEYAKRTAASQRFWFYMAICIAIAAFGLFALGQVIYAKQHRSGA